MDHILEIRDISCGYEDKNIVEAFSLSVSRGSLSCILGPSGCGKTTVLRAIAGFVTLTAGEIRLNQKRVSDPKFTSPPEHRNVGMVFQDFALFPHLTISANISAGLHILSKPEKYREACQLLERVGLDGYEDKYPHELSGGQQQRVALARALAPNPTLLLMDEPFSSLDLDLRERLGYEIRDLLKSQGITCVLVTHDQHDAFALADQVGVMLDGQLLQRDTPYNLYHEPASRFIADFIGDGVFLPGSLLSSDTVETELGVVKGNRAYPWKSGSTVDVLIRPDDIVPSKKAGVVARVVRKAFKGAEILYHLRLKSGRIVLSLFPSHLDFNLEDDVEIRLQLDHLVAFKQT